LWLREVPFNLGTASLLLSHPQTRLFGFAGLWETWPGDGEPVDTFTILTTDPNATVTSTQDRMPVIIDPADYGSWLDAAKSADGELLRPYRTEAMTATEVSTYVNDASTRVRSALRPGWPEPRTET
jgi:putative SOS response-associated peptidase YedK